MLAEAAQARHDRIWLDVNGRSQSVAAYYYGSQTSFGLLPLVNQDRPWSLEPGKIQQFINQEYNCQTICTLNPTRSCVR